jgi:hypothetical protein
VLPPLFGTALSNGLQIFKKKKSNFDQFWKALQWKMLVLFMTVCSILSPDGKFYGHFVHFVVIWYIFPVLVSCTEKNLATLVWNVKFSAPSLDSS